MSGAPALKRQTFKTSRLLEYFSEKELTLQTGHERERWSEVVLKELLDNSLDACEEADVLPEIEIAVKKDSIAVEDNGPGLARSAVKGILDFTVRTSSKDHYISPTRGAQGNALKTILAIPYVLSGLEKGEVSIMSRGDHHEISITVDRIAQVPEVRDLVSKDGLVKNGTRVRVLWPKLAPSKWEDPEPRFLQLVSRYACLNPHATFNFSGSGKKSHTFGRSQPSCTKWVSSRPTSPHWYRADQLRGLMAAYISSEDHGGRPRTVREFVSEFHGLSGTAKQKAILERLPLSGVQLRDFVRDGDVDQETVQALLDAMKQESRPVKPQALGSIGEAHLRSWLLADGGGKPESFKYKRIASVDDESGLPFVVEVAWVLRDDDDENLRLVTGINFAPTLANPFRELDGYGLGLDGLLQSLHIATHDPIVVVVHLVCPHLNYTDRGKSSLEAV